MSKELRLAQLDLEEKIARADKDLGSALERLHNNPDFKRLVLEGYFANEAVRLVHLKADPAYQTPERQASIIQQIDAIGSFGQYLTIVAQKADLAVRSLANVEATRSGILEEDE